MPAPVPPRARRSHRAPLLSRLCRANRAIAGGSPTTPGQGEREWDEGNSEFPGKVARRPCVLGDAVSEPLDGPGVSGMHDHRSAVRSDRPE
jgi:hypothetical protein